MVVSTCNGSGEARLEGQQFRIVVLDEASQVGWVAVQAGAEHGCCRCCS